MLPAPQVAVLSIPASLVVKRIGKGVPKGSAASLTAPAKVGRPGSPTGCMIPLSPADPPLKATLTMMKVRGEYHEEVQEALERYREALEDPSLRRASKRLRA